MSKTIVELRSLGGNKARFVVDADRISQVHAIRRSGGVFVLRDAAFFDDDKGRPVLVFDEVHAIDLSFTHPQELE